MSNPKTAAIEGNNEQKACKTPFEDLRKSALEHYNDLASQCHHWSSFVEHAIKAYQNPASPVQGISKEGEEQKLFTRQEVIDWTGHLGEMGWYYEKEKDRWVHDDETGCFNSTEDLVKHYLPIDI